MVPPRDVLLLMAVIATAACASVSPRSEQPSGSNRQLATVTLVIAGMT